MRAATVAELAATPKVTPKMAQRIYDYFHPPAPEAASDGAATPPFPEPGSDRAGL